jgi:hypothetical protein
MNFKSGMKQFSSIALMLASGTVLFGQMTTGSLAGSVKDAKGNPMAGVRVSVSSPALFAPRVLITDATGEWRAPLLPPGSYRVTVSKEFFVGSSAENIRVGLGTTMRQDLTMKPQTTAAATVEVVATAAEVDKSDTKSASNFSAEVLSTLPVSDRSFTGATEMSPGLTSGNNGANSIRGGSTQTTQYRVNGTDVKDDYQGSLTGTYVIEDNIEDVQVILSPLNARNGRTMGGAVNVVTKSGGNNFSGSVRATLDRSSWKAQDPRFDYQDGSVTDTLNKSYQVTLSGPIIPDRVWFSTGTILKPGQSYNYTLGSHYPTSNRPVSSGNAGVDAANGFGAGSMVPAGYGFTRFDDKAPYTQSYDDKYYEGKITAAITPDHTVEFSYSSSKVTLGPRDPFGDTSTVVARIASLGSQTEEKKAYGFNYRGVINNTTFIEGRVNKVDSRTVFPSGDMVNSSGERIYAFQGNSTTGAATEYEFPFGFGISPAPDRRNNRSANLNLKKFFDANGNHEIDFGIDYYDAVRGTSVQSGLLNQRFYVGGAYANNNGTGSSYLFPTIVYQGFGLFGQQSSGIYGPAPTLRQYVGSDGTTKNTNRSIYINDQWTINSHWNVMFGLRYDMNKVIDTTQVELANAKDLSPRFQAKYDLLGDSKHLFTFTAARFMGDFSISFTDAFVTKATSKYVTYGWTGTADFPGQPAPGTTTDGGYYGVRFATPAQLVNPGNYKAVVNFSDTSKGYRIDPNLKAPYTDELTFGYRRGWDNGSSVKLTFVHREFKRDWAYGTNYRADSFVLLTDPTNSGLASQKAQITDVFNSDDLKREYNGLEMEFVSKLSSIWSVGGNWTYSRLVGNNQGGDQEAGGQSFRDNAPSSYYNFRNIMQAQGVSDQAMAPTGPLFQDQRNRIRLFATADLPMGKGKMSYSWLLKYDTGTEWSAAAAYPLPTPVTRLAGDPAAPATYTNYYGGRGQYSDNDSVTCDFKVNYAVPLGWDKLQLIGDVLVTNVFNHMALYRLPRAINSASAGTPYLGLATTGATPFGTTVREEGAPQYWGTGRTVTMSIGLRY